MSAAEQKRADNNKTNQIFKNYLHVCPNKMKSCILCLAEMIREEIIKQKKLPLELVVNIHWMEDRTLIAYADISRHQKLHVMCGCGGLSEQKC